MNAATPRERMVVQQLVTRGISDARVLDAFRKVERHLFVSEKFVDAAYADHPLPIGEGQTISQPYMVALMTENLFLTGRERVLEIGTGSGYQAAILAELAKEVYTVERLEPLAAAAKERLDRLGYKNISVRVANGTLGWSECAPFERIIVTAGAPRMPESLLAQLGDGGKMVIPVGGGISQALVLAEKLDGKVIARDICGCVFVPLVGKEGWQS